jgi:hypothetical protein
MSITSPEVLDLVLAVVAAVIACAMVLGAVDLVRQPGWAWRAAGEPKAICLLLVLLLPGVGLAIYVLGARPKVMAVAATGRAASLPFERFTDRADLAAESTRAIEVLAAPAGLGSFGEPRSPRPVKTSEPVAESPAKGRFFEDPDVRTIGAAAEFFDTGVLVTSPAREHLGIHFPGGLGRPYHPKQRASLDESAETATVAARGAGGPPDRAEGAPASPAEVAPGGPVGAPEHLPTVPAGNPARWEDDPTGRHRYRYWDGSCWTESVSDGVVESRDPVRG